MDTVPVLTNLATLADPLRVRLLVILERHELAVSELCEVLQLPQSTVSRHLKTLADDGWVSSRRDGTSRLYSLAEEGRSPTSRQIWRLVRSQVAGMNVGERYEDITNRFNSIRDDAKGRVDQLDDGKLDVVERVSNVWM